MAAKQIVRKERSGCVERISERKGVRHTHTIRMGKLKKEYKISKVLSLSKLGQLK